MNEILIIGNGNVAWHLGRAMEGIEGLAFRNVDSRTAKFDCQGVDLVIIAVKDAAIREVAGRIETNGAIVVHTSGFTDMEVLTDYAENYGVIYPLQSLRKGVETDFRSLPLCIEANSEEALQNLKRIAQRLTAQVVELSSENRKYLHLAATFANNFTNHILGMSKEIMERTGLSFDMLFPLIDNTISAVKKNEPYDIQTGAARRDDQTTMEAHRTRLDDDKRAVYDILTQSIKNKNR